MKIAVFFADGFEEVEGLTSVDVFRRAGLTVLMVAVGGANRVVKGAHGITVVCDCTPADLNADDLAATVFPGGLPGATNLAADAATLDIVRRVYAKGGVAAAICAAPVALKAAGIITETTSYTCYPSFEKKIGGNYTAAVVQTDGRIVTGRGPGASAAFAFEILTVLGMAETARQLKTGMLFD